MAVEHHSCITITCDGCQAPLGDLDTDAPWHWESIEAARKDQEEQKNFNAEDPEECWEIRDDGTVVCPECLTQRRCGQLGHDWSDPFPWGPDRRLVRACERCAVLDQPLPPPLSVVPADGGGSGG